MKILGGDAPRHYIDNLNAEALPWYLRPNYDPDEILFEPNGDVKAGTVGALVQRLTAHEYGGSCHYAARLYRDLSAAISRSYLHQVLLNDVQVIHEPG